MGKYKNIVPRRNKEPVNATYLNLNSGYDKAKLSCHSYIPQSPTQAALRHPALTQEYFLGSNTKPLSSKVFRGRSGICCHSTTLAALLSRNNDRHVFLKSALLIFSDKNWSAAEKILAAIKPKAF